ncbi:MAG: hypothetical protein WC530_06510 [Candidatus Omnitrophota bacterium]|jgi:hypothetical protein
MRKLSLGFALLFLLQLGVSAPQSSVDPKQSSSDAKGSKAQKSLSLVAIPQALGDQIVKFFGRKTDKKLVTEKTKNVAGAEAAASQTPAGKPSVRIAATVPMKPGYVPPPPTPRASVSQIRQEIQKIFELSKMIKNVQSKRSVQLQRVQEQARIHQKILDALEASQKQTGGQKTSAKSALLAQEKLRIIHEETRRNAQAIEKLKEAPAETASKTAEKVKTVAS